MRICHCPFSPQTITIFIDCFNVGVWSCFFINCNIKRCCGFRFTFFRVIRGLLKSSSIIFNKPCQGIINFIFEIFRIFMFCIRFFRIDIRTYTSSKYNLLEFSCPSWNNTISSYIQSKIFGSKMKSIFNKTISGYIRETNKIGYFSLISAIRHEYIVPESFVFPKFNILLDICIIILIDSSNMMSCKN